MPRRNVNTVRRRQAAAGIDGTGGSNYTQLRDRPANHRHNQRPGFISDQWAPSLAAAFHFLIAFRLTAAFWSPISDCDEVYNYWEPLHFLLYGSGFQTWEYSPVYAIRSFAYVGLHYLPSRLFQLFLPFAKVSTFFTIRCLLSFICACSDILFYSSVCRKFGNGVGRLTLFFQALGAGYFISSAAFLPSSFAMAMTSFAFAFWMRSCDWAAVLCIAISALVGWPFAALLGAPIAIDMLLFPSATASTGSKKATGASRRWLFFLYSFVAGSVIIGTMIVCDTIFYGKPTLAPFNIVRYNIFTPHGPDLYGVAPVSYYVINLFLNWNVAAVLPIMTVPFTLALFWRSNYKQWLPVILVQLAYWGWLLTFFRQPHKEERFLYPVYSLLCVSAALTLDAYQHLIKRFCQRWRTVLADAPVVACLALFAVLSVSRFCGQCRYFNTPFDIYMGLNERLSTDNAKHQHQKVNVCVGKEWYRYPSSFFLPENAQLQFIKSEFAGLLPKAYPNVAPGDWTSILNITRTVPTEMNDMNKEEPSRYLQLSECDYFIDLETSDEGNPSEYEPNYSADKKTWTILKSEPFLISGQSKGFFRAFYVPYLSEKYCRFGNYNLLERKR